MDKMMEITPITISVMVLIVFSIVNVFFISKLVFSIHDVLGLSPSLSRPAVDGLRHKYRENPLEWLPSGGKSLARCIATDVSRRRSDV